MESPQQQQPVRFHVAEDEADGDSVAAAAPTSSAAKIDTAALAPDIMFSFHSLSIATRSPPSHLLTNVTGYVRRGGVTGVVGASGSGKTLLMKTLCGREAGVAVTGTVALNGKVIDLAKPNHMGFVPQEDLLIGELTVRETFRLSAQLHLASTADEIERQVSAIIAGLGLDHVADKVIGTVLKRGLSGGEKRRVSVGVELVARPAVICLDEPTSGLDASSAYVVLKSIRQLARNSNGQLCVLLSVHQPNARLLALFDDLLVLGRESMVYFGPPAQAVPYFHQLGFDLPRQMTPTDFIVHLVDQRFRTDKTGTSEPAADDTPLLASGTAARSSSVPPVTDEAMEARASSFDFPTMFHLSKLGRQVRASIEQSAQEPSAEHLLHPEPRYHTTWWRQFVVLVHRFAMVGTRDITLYLLQFALNCFYGFMVGAEFYQLPTRIGTRLQDYTNGIVWLVFVATYLQVFKVYYLMTMKQRYHHEHSNQAFATSAWSLSSLLVTAIFSFLTFIPGLLVAYFMMGMPSSAVGYVIFVLFLVVMATESLMDLLCQFCSYVPSAILLGQGTLVVLCVFAGGAFIKWSSLGFWVWLSECSIYTWATRGLMIRIFRDISYTCPTEMLQAGQCTFNGLLFSCDEQLDATSGTCRVRGTTVLSVYQDVDSDRRDEWFQAGILILLLGVFRLATYGLLRYPWRQLRMRLVHMWTDSPLTNTVLKQEALISTLVARVQVLERPTAGLSIPSAAEQLEQPGTPAPNVAIDMPAQEQMRTYAWQKAAPCPLRWQHLTLTLRANGQTLVDDLDGEARPGRVLAIMGPSGAGKTTMLNALSGRAPYAKITGLVQLGSSALSKAHLDYVPQFDLLNPSMSINRTFCIMAKLKNRDVDCDTRVVELLNILGLASRGEELVGSLSSGDRKRVSIGLGLISNPAVLFLDEPTTGLDSEAALVVVDYCVKVARATGVICVMTIHQPSAAIFHKLDHLLLLSRGKLAYFGSTRQAESYFQEQGFDVPAETNPADFFLDLMNAKTMQDVNLEHKEDVGQHSTAADPLPDWRQLFDRSRVKSAGDAATSQGCVAADPQRPSELQRLSVLLRSRMLYFWLERSIYLYRLVELILLGIFIGTLFLDLPRTVLKLNELAGAMFFNVWVVLFAAIGATPIFVRDRAIVENEYLNGAYELGTHVWALFLAALPYHLITAIVYQSIVWFLVGFHDAFEPWLFATLSTLSLLLLMEAVSLLVVEFLPNAMLATTGTMVALGTFFLFPGFFIKVPDMVRSVAWLSWVVPTKYSLDSQIANIFDGQHYETGMGGTVRGEDIGRDFFELDGRNKWGDWAVVMAYALGFRCLHYLALRWHYRMYSKGELAEK